MSQTTQITKADVHCYTKNGVQYVTPKASIARLRADGAKPIVIGQTFVLDGKTNIIWY